MPPPDLFVIAGPNGIGKTTSSFDIIPAQVPIINSDEIANAVRNSGMGSVNTQEFSNREATRLMNEYLDQKKSFAIETNLADVDTWKFLLETQKQGFTLNIIYLSTDSLDLLNDRIDARVLAGEHYIRPDIVEERYLNGLKLLNHYFEKPDSLQLFDNSGTLILIAEVKQGKVLVLNAPIPEWVEKYLSDKISPKNEEKIKKDIDLDTVEEVRKRYLNSKKDIEKLLPKKSPADQKKGLLPKKQNRNRKST
jgi:predicted ABC-type ATPase